MPNKILYKNHCHPQEQIDAGIKYRHDPGCGRKLTGSHTETVTSYTAAPATITATTALATTQDFVAIKALSIATDSFVLISLDNGSTYPIRLLEGECFASKIAAGAEAKVAICTAITGSGTGTGKVEWWSAT